MAHTGPIDTTNWQMVSVGPNDIIVNLPKQRMTKQEALVHAAWLVTLADDDGTFDDVLLAVHNT